jgi:hypothetical protein
MGSILNGEIKGEGDDDVKRERERERERIKGSFLG